jgi:glycosyltransferase involved in cell wall biosynthesis
MVSIIIPAYNEAKTVGAVVRAALSYAKETAADSGRPSEVIVVDDGSTDGTAEAARAAGASVIRLSENGGKASAMNAGVQTAKNDVIIFLDADVTGLDAEKIGRIAAPVLRKEREMYVGVRARKTIVLNALLHVFPVLGGERALTKELWTRVPARRKRGFEIEISLNHAAKNMPKGMGFELIAGVRNTIKEKKYGLAIGFYRRLVMIWQVLRASIEIYAIEPVKTLFAFADRV